MFKGYIRVGTDLMHLRYFLISESVTGSMALGMTGDRTSDEEKKIRLDGKQILGLVIGFAASLALLIFGYYQYFTCMAVLIVPALLYLVPHFFKVKNLKVMVMHGVVFTVVALLAGGLYVAPSYIDDNSEFTGTNTLTDADVTYTGSGYQIMITFDDTTGLTPNAELFVIDAVYFTKANGPDAEPLSPVTQTLNTASYDFPVGDQLYVIQFFATDTNNDRVEQTFFFLTDSTSESNKNSAIWMGIGYELGIFMLLYFMIVFLTYTMRASAKKTQARMVEQGRLYPEGYGRCKECRAIVLPGEVSCRKCGKYVDVPAEMKPEKKDFFTCSECDAEVPSDADTCPRCGAEFDEIEIEVEHADGTIETSTSTFKCPVCGLDVPPTAKFCPKCGETFEYEE